MQMSCKSKVKLSICTNFFIQTSSLAGAGEEDGVDEGVVGVEVHVAILGAVFERELVVACCQWDVDAVGESPIVPVGHAALREHYCADFLAVDQQGANGGFVLGVDRAVAVGVAELHGIDAIGGHAECKRLDLNSFVDLYEAVAVIAGEGIGRCVGYFGGAYCESFAGELDFDSLAVGNGFGGEGFHAVGAYADHLPFARLGGGPCGGAGGGHGFAVAQHNVATDVFYRIPCKEVQDGNVCGIERRIVLKACERRERRAAVGNGVHGHGSGLHAVHFDVDSAIPFELRSGDEGIGGIERLAIEGKALDARAEAADGDIELGAAVGEILKAARVGKGFGHERGEAQSVLLEVDAEEDACGQGDVAGERPEHVG